MLRLIARTEDRIVLTVARLAAGAVLLPHGAQKLLGWFGGDGWQGTIDFFTTQLGVPKPVAMLVIIAESFGAVGLLLGFLGRFCALGGLLVMGGAVYMVHAQNGFFMNWYGVPDQGHGYEYHILMMGLLLIVLIGGSGALSVDRTLSTPRR